MSILNLTSGSGEGSYIRFMPSLNGWVFNKEEIQVKNIVMDYDTIRTGWGKMGEGVAPEWTWDEKLGVAGPQPTPEHRRGFSINLWTKATGTVEWSTTGVGPVMGFETIFTQVWDLKDANPGMVPVLQYTGSEAIKIGKGNTRKPIFTIGKWVIRSSVPWNGDEAEAEPAPAAPAPKPAPKAAAKAGGSFSVEFEDD